MSPSARTTNWDQVVALSPDDHDFSKEPVATVAVGQYGYYGFIRVGPASGTLTIATTGAALKMSATAPGTLAVYGPANETAMIRIEFTDVSGQVSYRSDGLNGVPVSRPLAQGASTILTAATDARFDLELGAGASVSIRRLSYLH